MVVNAAKGMCEILVGVQNVTSHVSLVSQAATGCLMRTSACFAIGTHQVALHLLLHKPEQGLCNS